MPVLRIVAVPPGEAPADVRAAWIGLALSIDRRTAVPRTVYTAGVRTGPRGFWGGVRALVTGRCERMRGYALEGRMCIGALEEHAPAASAWWRRSAPHYLEPGRLLVFPVEVCELRADPTPRAG